MNDNSQNPTTEHGFFSKIASVVINDVSTGIFQFAKGAVSIAAISVFGVQGALIGGALMIGAGWLRVRKTEENQKRQLLHFYRDEVAAIVHKDPKRLTLDDLEKAAHFSPNGTRNALTQEFEAIEHQAKHAMSVGSITTALITAGSIAVSYFLPAVKLQGFISAAIAGVLGKITHDVVDLSTKEMAGATNPSRMTQAIGVLTQELKQRPVTPEQVLAAVMEAHPELDKKIQTQYGDRYLNLPVMTKQVVVESLEADLGTRLLADAINQRIIKPTELAFIAYGQRSGYTPPTQKTTASFASTDDPVLLHTSERAWSERVSLPAQSKTLH